jgi:hypothetical protein
MQNNVLLVCAIIGAIPLFAIFIIALVAAYDNAWRKGKI